MPNISNSVEKPRFLKENSNRLQNGRPQFLKEKPSYLNSQFLKEKGPLLKDKRLPYTDAPTLTQEPKTKIARKLSHVALKERLKLYETQIAKSSMRVNEMLNKAQPEDILSGITVCRSARFLQKYGCLHRDPVCGRKST